MALVKPKTAAKPAAKGLAKPAGKPAKAAKALAKPKAEPKIKFKDGDEVIFNGYSKETENPVFDKGDRLTVVSARTDDDKNVVLSAVKSEDYDAYKEDEKSVEGDEVYASEVEKAPKEIADPYALKLVEDEKLSTFIEDEGGGDALAAALAATDAIASNTFMLGGCLAVLYSEQAFRAYDPVKYADDVVDDKVASNSGWDKFTDANFGMNGRKAQAMIQIYRAFNRLGDKVDLAEISTDKKIGWVKLSAMANVVKEDNVEALIEAARTSNVEDFKSTIRTDYVGASGEAQSAGPKVKRTTIKTVFYEEAGASVLAIIEQVGKMLNTTDQGTIIEYVMMDWAHHTFEETTVAKIDKVRKDKLKELKKAGVDISERQAHFDALTAQIEGGDEDAEAEAETEAEAA